jgi:hypothetical protein
MRDYDQAETQFLARLRQKGIYEPVQWLPHDDFALFGRTLVIRNGVEQLGSRDIGIAFSLLENSECTFALVAVKERAYCTLLMDTFGTKNESEYDDSLNVYFLSESYFNGHVRVASNAGEWLWTKYILERFNRPLSSLDYAFSRSQAVVTT